MLASTCKDHFLKQSEYATYTGDTDDYFLPPAPLGLDGLGSGSFDRYVAVFTPMHDPKRVVLRYMRNTATVFGQGTQLGLFTADNILRLPPGTSADGLTVTVCVGIALANRPLPAGTDPFRSAIGGTSGPSKRETEANNRANASSRKKQVLGFDCVDAANANAGQKKLDNANAIKGRVFWFQGAAIPRLIVTLKLHKECQICREKTVSSGGISCPNEKHFTCWECTKDYIESVARPGALLDKVDQQTGCLRCPGADGGLCGHFFSGDDYRREAPSDVFEAFTELQVVTVAERTANEAREETEKRMKDDFERIQKLEGDERIAADLRRTIVNEILTLGCPRCKTAFVDFDGCFALTCSNNHCGAGFCAWCLKDCGADAHAHVNECPEGTGTFADLGAFNRVHQQRRKRAIQDILRYKSANVQRRVRELIEPDLVDLDIALDM
jgi:hypothetical protein